MNKYINGTTLFCAGRDDNSVNSILKDALDEAKDCFKANCLSIHYSETENVIFLVVTICTLTWMILFSTRQNTGSIHTLTVNYVATHTSTIF